ncbi:MAG: 2'-5' RNA ligase family protein [Candidatus Hodarchaeales archaeon]|jgi:2'-5' RNA ligase
MNPSELIDVLYRKIWERYSYPMKEGKLELPKNFYWYGRNWADKNNPPFIAVVFKIPLILWEPIQQIQADLEKTDYRQKYHFPSYFHVTLEEYGWEDKIDYEKMLVNTEKLLSNCSPFTVYLKGLNCFARTIFIQVFDLSKGFSRIYGKIHEEFPHLVADHPEYIPHVSIADILTNEARDLMTLVENKYREYEIGTITVDRLHVVRARPYLTVGRIEIINTVYLD